MGQNLEFQAMLESSGLKGSKSYYSPSSHLLLTLSAHLGQLLCLRNDGMMVQPLLHYLQRRVHVSPRFCVPFAGTFAFCVFLPMFSFLNLKYAAEKLYSLA